jgi:hypothetical protein
LFFGWFRSRLGHGGLFCFLLDGLFLDRRRDLGRSFRCRFGYCVRLDLLDRCFGNFGRFLVLGLDVVVSLLRLTRSLGGGGGSSFCSGVLLALLLFVLLLLLRRCRILYIGGSGSNAKAVFGVIENYARSAKLFKKEI